MEAMAETLAIDGSCAIRPPDVPEGSQCVLTDWGANSYPAHWVYTKPEEPQTKPEEEKPKDSCPAGCKGKVQVKRKTSYGPLYTTSTTNLDGSGTTYGAGIQSNLSVGPSAPQMCTTFGESPGVTSTVSGSLFGGSVQNSQSFGDPFSDAANSTQICVPTATPSGASPGVSVGIGGIGGSR
jgi:hypothetical protein